MTEEESQPGQEDVDTGDAEKNREEALVEKGHPAMEDLILFAQSLSQSPDEHILSDETNWAVLEHLSGCEFCANGLVSHIYEKGLEDSPALAKQDWWIKFKEAQEREE